MICNLQDALVVIEEQKEKIDDLRTQVTDLQWELEELKEKTDKYDDHLVIGAQLFGGEKENKTCKQKEDMQ